MTRIPASCIRELEGLEGIESEIGDSLQLAADELLHADCFGYEQRSEIYAILKALRDDTIDHRKTIRHLSVSLSGGGLTDA